MPDFYYALFSPTWWFVLALILFALEAILPGMLFVWFGTAAGIVGITALILPLGAGSQLALMAVLATVLALVGWKVQTQRSVDDAASELTSQGDALVGKILTLDEPLVGGEGSVRVGDSRWRVVGPNLAAGSSVRVTGLQGNALVVVAYNL